MSFAFNVFGVYCNSAEQPVILGGGFFTKIANGVSLLGSIPDPKTLNENALSIEQTPLSGIPLSQVTKCTRTMPSGTIYFNETQRTLLLSLFTNVEVNAVNFTTPTSFYDGTFCTTCQQVTICGASGDCQKMCIGDAFRTPNTDKTFLQKALCGNLGCEPPEHYFYSQTRNLYLCDDNSCTSRTLGQAYDQLLASKGATLFNQNVDGTINPSSDNIVGITCQDLKPRLAFFGIDVFEFKYWAIIMLIVLAFWGLTWILNAN